MTQQIQRIIDKILHNVLSQKHYDYRQQRYIDGQLLIDNLFNAEPIADYIEYSEEHGIHIQEDDVKDFLDNFSEQEIFKLISDSKALKQAIDNLTMDLVKDFIDGFYDRNQRIVQDKEHFENQEKLRQKREAMAEAREKNIDKKKAKKLIAQEVKKILKPRIKKGK